MHFINKGLLKLTMIPRGLYRRMGVDTRLLHTILRTKLIIDDRRPNTLQQVQKKDSKPISAATIGTIFISTLLGLLYLGVFMFSEDAVTSLTLYFTLFFFMLSASLISDFTSVLIDVRDNYIILPKPVSDRTFVVARVLHIFIHVCKLIVPMSLPGAVYMGIRFGSATTLPFLLMVLFLTLFVLFFINALYILILRITTPARFQSIISYVQIIFAISIYAGYQLLPRMASQMEGYTLDVLQQPLIVLVPTYWFAAGWHVLTGGTAHLLQVMAAVLSILVPVVSTNVVVRYLAPSFNNRLALMSSVSETKKEGGVIRNTTDSAYLRMLSRIFTRQGAERMGFLFTWKMTARSRDFKIKVYPAIGYMLVYMVLIFFRTGGDDAAEEMDATAIKVSVIGGIYLTSYLLVVAVNHTRHSDKYKAGWTFFTTPLHQPGAVILGSIKAAIFKFYIPMVIVSSAIALYFAGVTVVPNLLLGFVNQLLAVSLMVYFNARVLPFTLQERTGDKGGSFFKGLFVMFLIGFIGIAHFMIYDMIPAVLLCALVSLAGIWYLMGSIRNTSWEQIMKEYERH